MVRVRRARDVLRRVAVGRAVQLRAQHAGPLRARRGAGAGPLARARGVGAPRGCNTAHVSADGTGRGFSDGLAALEFADWAVSASNRQQPGTEGDDGVGSVSCRSRPGTSRMTNNKQHFVGFVVHQ